MNNKTKACKLFLFITLFWLIAVLPVTTISANVANESEHVEEPETPKARRKAIQTSTNSWIVIAGILAVFSVGSCVVMAIHIGKDDI
ncbi:MAG: hypothetical protein RR537_00015 [Longicatena sp.]